MILVDVLNPMMLCVSIIPKCKLLRSGIADTRPEVVAAGADRGGADSASFRIAGVNAPSYSILPTRFDHPFARTIETFRHSESIRSRIIASLCVRSDKFSGEKLVCRRNQVNCLLAYRRVAC